MSIISPPYIFNLLSLSVFFTYGVYLFFMELRGKIVNEDLYGIELWVPLICIAGYFWYTWNQWVAAEDLFSKFNLPNDIIIWKLKNEWGNALFTLLMCLRLSGLLKMWRK